MALPRQLPTGNDDGPIVGPFISSGGAAYYLSEDGITAGWAYVQALKSSNPSSTAFSDVGGKKGIRQSTNIADIDAYQVGDVLHCAFLTYTVPAMGDYTWYWTYMSFDMSDDSWDDTTVSKDVWSTTADPSLTAGEIRIMVRGSSDGDIAIAGKGTPEADMGSPFDHVFHGYYTTSWSTPTEVDGSVAGTAYRYPTISDSITGTLGVGSAGNYTVMWTEDDGTFAAAGRIVTGSGHTHGTSGAVGNAVENEVRQNLRNIVYSDSGTWRGSAVIADWDGGELDAVRYDPTSSDPFGGETNELDITGADVPWGVGGIYGLLAYDTSTDTRYCVYVKFATPDDIKVVSSVNEGTWGSADTIRSPANDTRLPWGHARVVTSPSDGSSTVIAYLYQDNTAGTAYYDEYVLNFVRVVGPAPVVARAPAVTASLGTGGQTATVGSTSCVAYAPSVTTSVGAVSRTIAAAALLATAPAVTPVYDQTATIDVAPQVVAAPAVTTSVGAVTRTVGSASTLHYAPTVTTTTGAVSRTVGVAPFVAYAPSVSVIADQTTTVGVAAQLGFAPAVTAVAGAVSRTLNAAPQVQHAPAVTASIGAISRTISAASQIAAAPTVTVQAGAVTRSIGAAQTLLAAPAVTATLGATVISSVPLVQYAPAVTAVAGAVSRSVGTAPALYHAPVVVAQATITRTVGSVSATWHAPAVTTSVGAVSRSVASAALLHTAPAVTASAGNDRTVAATHVVAHAPAVTVAYAQTSSVGATGVVAHAAAVTIAGPTLEGYRWRYDDGSEIGATWVDVQDTDVTVPLNTELRLRVIIDQPANVAYQLEAAPDGTEAWFKPEVEDG